MPLFHVQDPDRPAWVVAKDFQQAIDLWTHAVSKENDGDDPEQPQGVALICDDRDLILDDGFVDPIV